MSDVAVATPDTVKVTVKETKKADKPKVQPPYNIILLNDDDHSYEYVIEMLCKLFRMPVETAFLMAVEVDQSGQAIVDTTTKERAELKRDQIHAYGRDNRIRDCKGSMSARIEPMA
jgi:ATP-dependent Clp protease adaptor protein ClpS